MDGSFAYLCFIVQLLECLIGHSFVLCLFVSLNNMTVLEYVQNQTDNECEHIANQQSMRGLVKCNADAIHIRK